MAKLSSGIKFVKRIKVKAREAENVLSVWGLFEGTVPIEKFVQTMDLNEFVDTLNKFLDKLLSIEITLEEVNEFVSFYREVHAKSSELIQKFMKNKAEEEKAAEEEKEKSKQTKKTKKSKEVEQ